MRVVVADDAVLLREGLVRILTDDGYLVAAAVGTGPELVARPSLSPASARCTTPSSDPATERCSIY